MTENAKSIDPFTTAGKLADLAVAGHQVERLRDKMILGAGIDFLDDGVFF